jgi:hypothetical protein
MNYAGTHHVNLARSRGRNVRNHFFISASARFSRSSCGNTGTRSPFGNSVPGFEFAFALSVWSRPVPAHSPPKFLAHGKAPCDPRPQRPRTKAGVKTTANRPEWRNTRWSGESCLRQKMKSGRQLAGRELGLMHLRRCWLRNENARRREPSSIQCEFFSYLLPCRSPNSCSSSSIKSLAFSLRPGTARECRRREDPRPCSGSAPPNNAQ